MQNNALTLSNDQRLSFNQPFSTTLPISKSSKVIDKYNELQNAYLSKFNELNFDIQDVKCIADRLIYICLANDISKRKLWKVSIYLKLVEKQRRYNYCLERLESFNNDEVFHNLIENFKIKNNKVGSRINLILSNEIKFPNLTDESIISKEKYNKILKKKYKKLLPVFKQLNNDEYIEEYDNLRIAFSKFIERVEAIVLFRNVIMSDISCIKSNYAMINEIFYCNYLLRKVEKYASKNKLTLENEIDNIENSLFDLVIDFDKNVGVLRDALNRVTN
jgi:hypothetical protein